MALSTAKAEYIAVGYGCAQVIWLNHQLLDYGVKLSKVPLYCDNTSVINLTKNPIQHSKTMHIEIRHHFIRSCSKVEIVKFYLLKLKINWLICLQNH